MGSYLRLIRREMVDSGITAVSTLTTLFLVGFVRNSLIFQTGHIGYSWALHFGWMVVMFGSIHIDLNSTLRVTEPARFNLYLGSIEMLIISIIIAGLSLTYWARPGAKSYSSPFLF